LELDQEHSSAIILRPWFFSIINNLSQEATPSTYCPTGSCWRREQANNPPTRSHY